ncbi:MAG: ACT domain-containing protein, partial [Alphaproteobacteria bacterium]
EVNVRPLTAVVLEGLLRPLMDNVNMVNAPVVAKQRNIDVSEVVHDRQGDFHTLIRLTVRTEKRRRTIAGTLFANSAPRIVNLMGMEIEAELGGRMLFVANDDKPGFIGGLGTILGDAGINIGTFNLGRDRESGSAIALISVDQELSEQVLKDVGALPHVRQVKALEF